MPRIKTERNIYFDDVREKYYVGLDFGADPKTGKQIRKWKTFTKLKEAQKCLRKHETQKDEGKIVSPKETTLNELLTEWMDTVVRPYRASSTTYGYENIIHHVNGEIGMTKVQELKPSQIQKYYAALITEKGLSTNTVRKHHDLLNSVLKYAVKHDLLHKNPMESVESPTFVKPDIDFYNREEVERLLELCNGHRIELIIKLACMLGLRREEILGLRWDCVDFTNQELEIKRVRTQAGKDTIVKKPKTDSSRRILFFPDEILELLLQTKEQQNKYKELFGPDYHDEGYVYTWEDGSPFRPNYASDLFKKFIEDNQLPYITLHGLRHSFATLASKENIPLFDLSKALGHSSIATTTKIYTHHLDKGHRDLMNTLWKKK